MNTEYYDEGARCPEVECDGFLEYAQVENCSCHINPPCSACTDASLSCKECGFEAEEPPYEEIPVATGLVVREYRPKPLDNSRIDYRVKPHSNSSMLKEGVYPSGTTQKEVRAIVDGTFGGRFEQFGGGHFTFVAYTD